MKVFTGLCSFGGCSKVSECLLVILGLVESLYPTSVVIVWVRRRAYLVYINY